jgi:hypothetical protein
MNDTKKPRPKIIPVPAHPEVLAELREGAKLADLPVATWLRRLGQRETRRLKAANGGAR